MIDLKQLIQVAGFKESVQKDILDKLPTFSEAQQFQTAELCWQLIIDLYNNDLQFELERAAGDVVKGEKTLTKEDIQKIKDEIFDDLIKKFQIAGDQKKIEEVRSKLIEQTAIPADSPQTN